MNVLLWSIPEIPQEVLLNEKCHWDKNGLQFVFTDLMKQKRINICFPTDSEYYRVRLIEQEAVYNDDIFDLMQQAGCDAPINPFFILTETSLIEEILNRPYFDRNKRDFQHYVMITEDMWIDVVSSQAPTVSIKKAGV